MAAAAHGADPTGIVDAGGVVMSAVAAVYAAFLRPFSKKARHAKKIQKTMTLWFTGADGIDGVSPELVPAPVQLARVQADVKIVLDRLDEVLRRVSVPGA